MELIAIVVLLSFVGFVVLSVITMNGRDSDDPESHPVVFFIRVIVAILSVATHRDGHDE